jgi:predicted alpha/beta superfamily hydrolase
MRDEMIPDIERQYRTTSDRTYIGYSLGGLFGAYVLFHAPDTFKRMILVSPSLWWDNGVEFKDEERFAADHKSLPVRLFMSVGELETDQMLGSMRRMANALADRDYRGLELQTRILEGESHMSTFPVAVTRGLKTVFAEEPKH